MQDNDKTMTTHTLGDVVAEMRERAAKALPDNGLIGPCLVLHWADRLEAIAADRGDSRALNEINGFLHEPADFEDGSYAGPTVRAFLVSLRGILQAAQSRAWVVDDAMVDRAAAVFYGDRWPSIATGMYRLHVKAALEAALGESNGVS